VSGARILVRTERAAPKSTASPLPAQRMEVPCLSYWQVSMQKISIHIRLFEAYNEIFLLNSTTLYGILKQGSFQEILP